MSQRAMSKEAIEARQQRVRELLDKYPDISMSILRQRTGAGETVIRRIKERMKQERRVE